MAHCTKCGNAVDAAAAYCQMCGQRQPVAGDVLGGPQGGSANTTAEPASNAAASATGAAAEKVGKQSGLQENVAAALCYAGVWVTGIIFLLIDKRPYVQFHAAQSIVIFGALWILRAVIGLAFGMGVAFRGGWNDWGDWGMGRPVFWGVGGLLLGMIQLTTLVLWIVMMVKAYQGEKLRLPLAADLADSFAGK